DKLLKVRMKNSRFTSESVFTRAVGFWAAFPTLTHLADDSTHFFGRKGAQGLGADVAMSADGQAETRHGRLIRRLGNQDRVVLAERPINLLHSDAEFLGRRLDGLHSFRGVLDGADTLIAEMPEHNESSHGTVLLFQSNICKS